MSRLDWAYRTRSVLGAAATPMNAGRSRLASLPFPVQLTGLTCLALAVPLYGDDYVTAVGVSILTFAMLGIGLNIVIGYAGLLDLGYAAFFAIGAYTTAIMTVNLGFNFWLTLIPAVLLAGVAGAALGYPTLRLRSDYLAIVTLGFGEMVRVVFTNWSYVNGPNGIYAIPPPSIFGFDLVDQSSFYVIGVVLVLIALTLSRNLSISRLGQQWVALREDEFAAEAVGVPTLNIKLLAYTLGGMWAGLAGAFYASRISAIDPTSFTFMVSSQVVILVVIGGLGSLPGAILGAAVVVGLPEVLRPLQQTRFLFFAVLLVLMMLFRPQGLWPHLRSRVAPFTKLKPESQPLGQHSDLRREAIVTEPAVLLEVEDLVQAFGGVKAVDHVSFNVRRGEIVSIIGPNGAGKTTVFNCITGVQRPKSGQVAFRGRAISGLRPHRIARKGIARTFQGIRLFKEMAVFENVMVGVSIRDRTWPWDALLRTPEERRHERRALAESRYWLAFLGLEAQAGRLANQLAYADQRRVEIARALASQPELLLLDEPAAGMNPVEKLELSRLVRSIREQGITVIIIDHDMSLIMRVSDRVIVLDRGRVIADGLPADIQANQHVIDAYLGEESSDSDEQSARVS